MKEGKLVLNDYSEITITFPSGNTRTFETTKRFIEPNFAKEKALESDYAYGEKANWTECKEIVKMPVATKQYVRMEIETSAE